MTLGYSFILNSECLAPSSALKSLMTLFLCSTKVDLSYVIGILTLSQSSLKVQVQANFGLGPFCGVLNFF